MEKKELSNLFVVKVVILDLKITEVSNGMSGFYISARHNSFPSYKDRCLQ